MFSDPKIYFDLLIEPIFARFKREPNSYELAISTAVITYHFVDVYAAAKERNDELPTKKVNAYKDFFTCMHPPVFGDLAAVANAAKHGKISYKNWGEYRGLAAEDLTLVQAMTFKDGAKPLDTGGYAEHEEVIGVVMPDSRKVDFVHTCREVKEILRGYANEKF